MVLRFTTWTRDLGLSHASTPAQTRFADARARTVGREKSSWGAIAIAGHDRRARPSRASTPTAVSWKGTGSWCGSGRPSPMRPDEATVNEPAPTGTALVQAEYHLFHITDPQGPVAGDLDASRTGLVSADGGAIEVATGIHTGDVHVTVEAYAQAPEPAPGWEEIAEISCHSSSGELLVTSFMDDPADLPSLASQGPGPTGCASTRAVGTGPSTRRRWPKSWSRT
jgi:hypothetical protein